MNRVVFGLDMLKEMEQEVLNIKQKIKIAHHMKKSYIDQ